jgi:hypothetical protein
MTGVNLIPEHRREAHRRHKRTKRWLATLSIYCALSLSVWVGVGTSSMPSQNALAGNIAQAQAMMKQLSVHTMNAKSRIGELEASERLTKQIADLPDWSMLLVVVGTVSTDEILLRNMEISAAVAGKNSPIDVKQYTVRLNGYAPTQPAVSRLVQRLTDTGVLDSVKITRSGREPFQTGTAISFEISCTIGSAKKVKS